MRNRTRLNVGLVGAGVLAGWLAGTAAWSAETPSAAPTFATAPKAVMSNGKVTVTFAVSGKTDVEVAILDAKGPSTGSTGSPQAGSWQAKVVRHLAAGVLGDANPPPAPLKPNLAQSLEWDGKDDYGVEVPGFRVQGSGKTDTPFQVRVRAGMGVKLDTIVGGDPYAFYSKEIRAGDHGGWNLTGLEAKPDGNVYVMGNACVIGSGAIRQYDTMGNYRRTVFPFPAGKPIEDVKGWGVNVRADGTYSPTCNSSCEDIIVSSTLINGNRGYLASLVPTPDKDKLTLSGGRGGGHRLMTVGTDGTLRDYKPAPFFSDPPLPAKCELHGPFHSACSPDGKTMCVSGLFAFARDGSDAQTNGFWRDGQVWKVDLATRKASVFFALDEKTVIGDLKARNNSPIELAYYRSSLNAAFHGVAVDADNNVLICDRQNKRIVAVDKDGKLIREIPNVMYPDAIAVNPRSKALYVTTRKAMKLLKFNDWTKDDAPVVTLPLGSSADPTYLAVCENNPSTGSTGSPQAGSGRGGEVLVWFAQVNLSVRIYRDKGANLELVKDFYEASGERLLNMEQIAVDAATEDVYATDGFGSCWRLGDWKAPRFALCMQDEKKRLGAPAGNMAIDSRNRRFYAHNGRYKMDGPFFPPDPVSGSGGNVLTPGLGQDWRIGHGNGGHGIAVAPDGSLATLGAVPGLAGKGVDYGGYLVFFKADPAKAPWEGLYFKNLGSASSGGIRFDFRGNLYVGIRDGKCPPPPAGFEKDKQFLGSMGRIFKYAPTGSMGNLFPTEPAAPAKVYDVHFGSFGSAFVRTPRFGMDGYGRIYYPTSMEPRVSVIDNEGNSILAFGTYGNRDSMGGLAGDLVPTKDIPMIYPNSVDVTDDYIYVGDKVNVRLLRLAKTFAATETVGIE